ncbi:MAG TPA: lipopolysaccharide biosynthesis protein [Beijerinckiaceae bacterium]|jgi:O-antigen/teichoic acid export membrane protein
MSGPGIDAAVTALPAGAGAGLVRRARRALDHEGAWSAGAQALASGMSFLVSIGAARALGIEEFGRFVLILTGVFIVGALQYQVVSSPMMTAAGLRRRSDGYYGAVTRWLVLASLLSGLAVALYVLALYGWQSGRARLDLAAAGFAVGVGIVLHDGLKRILFATRRPRLAFLFEALRYGTFAAAAIAAWATVGIGTAGLLLCLGLAPIAVALPLLVPMLRNRPRRRLKAAVFARHWDIGRWMALMVLVSTAHEHAVTVAAGTMLGEWAAAGLRSAQILFGPILVLMMSLENVVPRRAAERYSAGGRPALARYLKRVLLLGLVPIAGYCLGAAAFEDELLSLLLGPAFTAFDQLVTIVAVVPALVLARELGMVYLRTLGETRGVFVAFLGSAVVTMAALIPLIHGFGVIGAALAFVLGHAVSTAFVLVRAWRG